MAFCTTCGTQVSDEIKFCTKCGNPMGEAPRPMPVASASQTYGGSAAFSGTQPPPMHEAAPVFTSPPPSGDAPPPYESPYAVMGVGSFFGHTLLFSIPFIGWLICLIMAFTSKNHNKRNFARSTLIFIIVGIILSISLYFIFAWIAVAAFQYINGLSSGAFGEFDGISGIFDMLRQAGNIPGQ